MDPTERTCGQRSRVRRKQERWAGLRPRGSAALTRPRTHLDPSRKEAAAVVHQATRSLERSILPGTERPLIIQRDPFFERLANPECLYNECRGFKIRSRQWEGQDSTDTGRQIV